MSKDDKKSRSRDLALWRFGKQADTANIEKGLTDSSSDGENENESKRRRLGYCHSDIEPDLSGAHAETSSESTRSTSSGDERSLNHDGEQREHIDSELRVEIEDDDGDDEGNAEQSLSDSSDEQTGSEGADGQRTAENIQLSQEMLDSGSDNDDFSDISDSEEDVSDETNSDSSNNDSNRSEHQDSDDSTYNDNHHHNPNRELPLYPGALISVIESVMMIMTFALRHCLTSVSMADLLKLIVLHCPPGSACVRTLNKLRSFFSGLGKEVLVFHYYCSQCIGLLDSKDSHCIKCGPGPEKLYFIEVPLLHQLQVLFKRPGFYQDLQFRFTRRKKNVNNIEDIYDGNIYKFHVTNGLLSIPQNISFMWYSDGVSVFNCSKFSIWPLYFVINELSYKNRTKKENIILAGMWFGKIKPRPNTFLTPIHSSVSKFEKEGYSLKTSNNETIRVKGKVICGTCDLPAKSLFLRMKQFNGFYGCPRCKERGERFQTGRTSVHVYPYSPNFELRSDEEYEQLARVAVASKEPCLGVKGPAVLFYMMSKIFTCTGCDVMHGVFSGLSKQLLTLLFHTAYNTMDFSLRHAVAVINERMRKIKPPSFVPRMPQCVDDLAGWKSLDYKIWFFYYSVITMLGIMKKEYLDHHMKVVSAVYLLSRESISREQIERARALLHNYVKDFQKLYGLRHMSANVHQLLHLPDVVLDLGPLWVYSCYFLEDLNGQIVKLCHGTRHAALQICSTVCIYFNMSASIQALNVETPVRKYCEKLTRASKQLKISEVISPRIQIVGTLVPLTTVPLSIEEPVLENLQLRGGHYQLFYRILKQGILFCSEAYSRKLQTQSSFVSFVLDGESCLGKIVDFARRSGCNCQTRCLCQPADYICLIRCYRRILWEAHDVENVNLPYMSKVQKTEKIVAIHISDLDDICFYVEQEEFEFIVERSNRLEKE